MKATQFIKDHGLERARKVVEGAPEWARYYSTIDGEYYLIELGAVLLPDLERLVESLECYSKFANKQEALDAINNAPDGATDYRKLSCGTRYIKQGPRFYEYWNGSEWRRPTVPLTDETHILRFDKLSDLKQAIADYESIYGEGNE